MISDAVPVRLRELAQPDRRDRALRPAVPTPADSAPARLSAVLATCLALTFLNPHVHLETAVLLGSLVATSH